MMNVPLNFKLSNFFIFNPTVSNIEGEEEKKILYYYPANANQDVRLRNAGLCEALVKFTASFHPDKPCQVFSTAKTKQLLHTPEADFWMVLTISAEASGAGDTKNDPSHAIPENVFGSILQFAYRTFKLFHGTFSSSICNGQNSLAELKTKLELFYNLYLSSLCIEKSGILDVYQGIQYLPLSKEAFIHVQSFINVVQSKFPCIRHPIFLYNDHLVWSGVDPCDMQVLYHYLVKTLLPAHPHLELHGASTLPGSPVSYGSFVTAPSHLFDHIISSTLSPVVHLTCRSELSRHHLVVYRALSATLCLLLPESTVLTLDLFTAFEEYIGPKLTSVVSEIAEERAKTASPLVADSNTRFFCFNRLNSAVKTSALEVKKAGPPSPLTPEIMRILASLNADPSLCCDNHEVMLGLPNDTWLVLKCSNGRDFYVVTHKKSSVRDAVHEVRKVYCTQLKGIFFLA